MGFPGWGLQSRRYAGCEFKEGQGMNALSSVRGIQGSLGKSIEISVGNRIKSTLVKLHHVKADRDGRVMAGRDENAARGGWGSQLCNVQSEVFVPLS